MQLTAKISIGFLAFVCLSCWKNINRFLWFYQSIKFNFGQLFWV